MRMFVTVKTTFDAVHCWPEAPTEVSFLRSPHRHVFHVKAVKLVTHADRDIEFILLKREIDRALAALLATGSTAHWSCEMFAVWLIEQFALSSCEVSEDAENGAIVHAD